MEKPSKQAVIDKLHELVRQEYEKDSEGFVYKTKVEKAFAALRQRNVKKKESCYCIEGLLCEAAIQLGFPGKWGAGGIIGKDNFIELTESGSFLKTSASYVPDSVCKFLGVPNIVDFDDEEKTLTSFLELDQQTFQSNFGKRTYPRASRNDLTASAHSKAVALWRINDNTPASLKQMMDFIIKLIKQQPEPETNETN